MIDRDKQLVALADEMGKAGGAARVPPVWIDRLRAILAAPSPSREELREKIEELVSGVADDSCTVGDTAVQIMALLPASRDEGMLRETVQKALDRYRMNRKNEQSRHSLDMTANTFEEDVSIALTSYAKGRD